MIPFIPFFLLVSILSFHTTAYLLNNGRLNVSCTGSSYTVNSTYEANLNTLLPSLADQSSFSLYNKATFGTSGNRIYGHYVCQGDLSPEDCQACVRRATININNASCPSSRQAIIWYDYCMLRYSDANFFGVSDTHGFSMQNLVKGSTSLLPYQMVSNLVHVAPFRQPMFASNASTSTSSFVTAQCTDDLTPAGCSQCLNTILSSIKNCCLSWIGWRYLSPSCSIRYEVYSFLQNLNGTYTQIVESTCSANSLPSDNKLNNRNHLLSDVTSKAVPTGFYNDTQSGLFGLALCRADIGLPSGDCNDCLSQANAILTTKYCPNNTQGTVWYEKCMVRYSNESFFGVVDYDGKSYCGVEPINTDDGSNNIAFVTTLVGVAANNTLMFAANDTGDGSSQQGYALVQCSRDLSSEDCENCLQKGISVLKRDCKQTNGWRYLSGSCTIRYEEFAFFSTSAIGIGAPATQFAPPAWRDENKRSQLDWSRRRLIIAGIARGLLYLHEDSLLKVIHRDLKASNVLLDNAMNPKISDFGMAKISETDVTDVNTGRVVGTFGYMAPEYAMNGIFSEKSDVYSFGVLLLEIVSGQKNGQSHFEQHGQTLLRRAWQLWSENRAMELIDVLLGDLYPQAEAMKVVHIGLLCVQENVEERPTMSSVVIMLRTDQIVYPEPSQPPTFFRQRRLEADLTSSTMTTSSTKGPSVNEVTITETTPR